MIRRPPRSTLDRSSAASDVYKRQNYNSLPGLSAGNFVIQKATPTATLAVNNTPQTYTGSGQAATVGITASSVPGSVANILTGGAATQTSANTYAVTADFVPTDT